MLSVKICGLSTPDTLDAALDAGADMVGLVFHPKSPRCVTPERAVALADAARGRAQIVALVVDPTDADLADLLAKVRPDVIQLHGSETVERVTALLSTFRLPLLKAVGIATAADVATAAQYRASGATLLVDAKPPKDAAYPGGHGRPFDWTLLSGLPADLPFLLSGGLSPDTVADAIATVRGLGVRLTGVDVSSGVESAPGIKDVAKIRAFVAAARAPG